MTPKPYCHSCGCEGHEGNTTKKASDGMAEEIKRLQALVLELEALLNSK